jgi:hypothetical protein
MKRRAGHHPRIGRQAWSASSKADARSTPNLGGSGGGQATRLRHITSLLGRTAVLVGVVQELPGALICNGS